MKEACDLHRFIVSLRDEPSVPYLPDVIRTRALTKAEILSLPLP